MGVSRASHGLDKAFYPTLLPTFNLTFNCYFLASSQGLPMIVKLYNDNKCSQKAVHSPNSGASYGRLWGLRGRPQRGQKILRFGSFAKSQQILATGGGAFSRPSDGKVLGPCIRQIFCGNLQAQVKNTAILDISPCIPSYLLGKPWGESHFAVFCRILQTAKNFHLCKILLCQTLVTNQNIISQYQTDQHKESANQLNEIMGVHMKIGCYWYPLLFGLRSTMVCNRERKQQSFYPFSTSAPLRVAPTNFHNRVGR